MDGQQGRIPTLAELTGTTSADEGAGLTDVEKAEIAAGYKPEPVKPGQRPAGTLDPRLKSQVEARRREKADAEAAAGARIDPEGYQYAVTGGDLRAPVQRRQGLVVPPFEIEREAETIEPMAIRRKANETAEQFAKREAKFGEVQRRKEEIARGEYRRQRRAGSGAPGVATRVAQVAAAVTGKPGLAELPTLAEIAAQGYSEGVGGSLLSTVAGLREDPTALVTGPFSQVLRSQLRDEGLREATERQFERVRGVLRPQIAAGLEAMGLGDLDPGVLPQLTPEQQQTWTAKVFGALGSTVPQAVLAALPLGRGASAAFGALQGTGSAFMEAKQAGATDEVARMAGAFGSVLGLVDALGGPESGDFLKPGLGGTIKRIVESGAEEGLTEGLQRVGENINAALIAGYDPKRALLDGVAENAILGAVIGGGFGIGGEAARFGPARTEFEEQVGQATRTAVPTLGELTSGEVGEADSLREPVLGPEREANLRAFAAGVDPRLRTSEGLPREVYHGTPFGDIEQVDPAQFNETGTYGPGFYATSSPERAAEYAGTEKPYQTDEATPAVGAYYLDIRKPFDAEAAIDPREAAAILDAAENEAGSNTLLRELRAGLGIFQTNAQLYEELAGMFGRWGTNEILKAAGYDGIRHIDTTTVDYEEVEPHEVWVAFRPEQVKSATGNIGTFDPTNPLVSESVAGPVALDLAAMEQRAAESGRPVALTPETRDRFEAEANGLRDRLMEMDPTGSEFDEAVSRAVALRTAVEDAKALPDGGIQTPEQLRAFLVDTNIGSEAAADEMMERLGAGAAIGQDIGLESRGKAGREAAGALDPSLIRVDIREGSQPAIIGPPELFRVLEFGSRDRKGNYSDPSLGVSIEMRKLGAVAARIDKNLDPEKAAAVKRSIQELVQASRAAGLNSIILLNEAGPNIEATRLHEQVHAGQVAAVGPVPQGSPRAVLQAVPKEFVDSHETVAKAGQTALGEQIVRKGGAGLLAAELPAYIAEGRAKSFGLSTAEAIDYVLDYLDAVVGKHGVDAVDRLTRVAMPKGSTLELYNQARRSYGLEEIGGPGAGRGAAGAVPGPDVGGTAASGGVGGPVQAAAPGGPQPGTSAGGAAEGDGGGSGEAGAGAGGTGGPTDGGTGGPRDGGLNGPGLYEKRMAGERVREIARKFQEIVQKQGLKLEPGVPVFLQVTRAIMAGKINLDDLIQQLADQGVDYREIADEFGRTISEDAKDLNALSQIEADWRRLFDENPGLAAKMLPVEKFVKLALSDLKAGRLGRSLWERAGDQLRTMALGQIATAATQAMGTMAMLPLKALDAAGRGIALGLIDPKKYGGMTAAGRAEAAFNSALREMKPLAELLSVMTPKALRKVIDKDARTGKEVRADRDGVLERMRYSHPDQYRELVGATSRAEETGTQADVMKLVAQAFAGRNFPDVKKREALQKEFRELQRRAKFNDSVAGKVVRGIGWAYEQPVKPLMWQEMFFRGPIFVGALRGEAELLGHDLNELIASDTLSAIPADAMQRAIDQAMTMTMAYNPKRGAGAPGVEQAAAAGIQMINKLGPVGFVIEGFPRMMYNGLKFMYEYGPLGLMHPAWSIGRDVHRGRFDEYGRPLEGAAAIQAVDVDRLVKGMVGTAALAVAFGLRKVAGGEEWWQIKTGAKYADGKPIYVNMKNIWPIAGFLWSADMAIRIKEGRNVDKSMVKDFKELYLSMRRAGDQGSPSIELLDAMAKHWGGDEDWSNKMALAEREAGSLVSLWAQPLVNVRDLFGQFTEGESRRKELAGTGLWGPSLDKLPWFRRDLPDYESLTEEGPQYTSLEPATRFVGLRLEAPEFATRELARLGINPTRWMKRDPDPTIDQAQRALMGRVMGQFGSRLATLPAYIQADDAHKAMIWEEVLGAGDPDGILQEIKDAALDANPRERARRETIRESGMGPLGNRATGFERKVNEKLGPGAPK